MINVTQTDCEVVNIEGEELQLFGYQQKLVLSLSVHPDLAKDPKALKFPQDSQINCQFRYYAAQDKQGTSSQTLLINVLQKYGQHYDPDTNHIKRVPLAAEQYNNTMLLLNKQVKNKLTQRVHEITQTFIYANGQAETDYKMYFAGQASAQNLPYSK